MKSKQILLHALIFSGITVAIILSFVVSKSFFAKTGSDNEKPTNPDNTYYLSFETATTAAITPDNSVKPSPSLKPSPPVSSATAAPEVIAGGTTSGANILPEDLRGNKPLPYTPPPSLEQEPEIPDKPEPTMEDLSGMEEDTSPFFHLVSGHNPPEWWVTPVFSVEHNDGTSTTRWYFNVKMDNIDDYKDVYSIYSYRIECINYPQLNNRQMITPMGLPGDIYIVDKWIHFGDPFADNVTLYDISVQCEANLTSLPAKYYTTIEEEKNFILMPGMVVKYRIYFRAGDFEQIFEKYITLHNI